MTTATESTLQAEIREVLAARNRAIGAKDVDAIMGHYADDLVHFDAIPPFQSRGASGLRDGWESCLPHFPDRFGMASDQLAIFGADDSAAAHWIWRFTDLPEDHPALTTCLRATAILKRRGGEWKIVHEHCSVPFDPCTSQAFFQREP
ncbi:MAG: nuclear transport factor 2 family protein [Candidatus Hydrogenedentes bacterium]|nr:nuclear transport factor 2 family protein [Candidatus Hydrogenedentota bacterium]